jgi:prepilin-type N-terminal cleavage/methylation domain-containing protein
MSMLKLHPNARGFSLIELMIVIAILSVVMGAVFSQITGVQQRYRTEEAKLDIAQESREFLDQMVRDLHQAGYPTSKMYDSAVFAGPTNNDHRVAAGLVKFAYNDVWFEGDVDGDGLVESVRYTLSTDAGGMCPCTIKRSQQWKLDNPPMSQTVSYTTELQNVINSGGAYTISGTGPGGTSNTVLYGALAAAHVFEAYDATGAPVVETDIASNPTLLGSIRTIKITVNVLAAQKASDMQTGLRAPISLTASARLSN